MMSLLQHPDDLKSRDVSHCVVLTCHSKPSPQALEALSAANLDFVVANNELSALAQALLCERLDKARATWGLRPTGCICLIIEATESWTESELLIDAMGMYCDNAIVLHIAPCESTSSATAPYAFGQPPDLPSPINPEEDPNTDSQAVEEDSSDRTDFISAEEIAMLLDRTNDEDILE